ncbi:bifunctional (p)ppGpp synthetase/guanosine-3',5'-bis(diphosphate) 3'-pyrophosphohydrolase [Methylomarinum sp. Ch1-1]|uniref:GTP pyrophosphokinase n=1 Tax=Methylomarinum roseum TaxID=3067653 RepID=A0AAU7NYW7_9GAMM|nr:bifunctional (p)ppGpp synthetase/guanosine-3',5'-bis(diphosphate) 3'-pyrophosphohydrolase [Methylomarinum sp. Ch1-1]MDP4521703.1 bifunctional (p)ppGpp synthetase/guanosine-3',5'-bis(diphosphate) 3'-pyrophosphohydrolase [Methylomarinum sp. Ch1-1]
MYKEISAIDDLAERFSGPYQDLMKQALALVDEVKRPKFNRRPRGPEVALILAGFHVDAETLLAAVLSDPLFNDVRPDFDFKAHFGETVAALVKDVIGLNRLKVYSTEMADQPNQAEILRRMLFSVIKDVRAVLVKLAYRVHRLRHIAGEEYEVRRYIARETLDIYAPIANRLGVSQLKWELEDLAFRYLQPQSYLQLVKSLTETRVQREDCIARFIAELEGILEREQISAEIAGRPKHLYSIWKKMQRKQLDIDELYDLLAVRVIVDKLTTCYAVLGMVHERWQYIPKEFDDYIANPKPNGYQSLHTVVLDQQGHRIEVQIRTRSMHEFAELGVAAHWRYKEGGHHSAAVDKNIASLRKLLDDRDGDEQLLAGFKTEMFGDRVYVLTPAGKLIDLIKGATPLDFAYAIHTEVGHRCRGAKVNGRIVPLTYPLKTGERVEILTAKEGGPNRQWIDPHLGYLKTPRAVGKVKSWIKQQSFDKNLAAGRKIIDKLFQQLGRSHEDIAQLLDNFKLADEDKLLVAVGRGDITPQQLQNVFKKPARTVSRAKAKTVKSEILVDGINNVATTLAHCCEPEIGDDIIGFITHHKGITIHKRDCENIVHLSEQERTQLIDVSWRKET